MYKIVHTSSETMMPMGRVPLRIAGFLRGGGDGVESYIGEEYIRGAGADAGEAEGREGAPVVSPTGGIDVTDSQGDYE